VGAGAAGGATEVLAAHLVRSREGVGGAGNKVGFWQVEIWKCLGTHTEAPWGSEWGGAPRRSAAQGKAHGTAHLLRDFWQPRCWWWRWRGWITKS
jgi:hypothetical protein